MEQRHAALIDASIVYGANRWLRGVHDEPAWPYRGQYRATDDKRLFSEFLHLILLFDCLVLDNSSVERIGREIRELFAHVNAQAGARLLTFREVATTKTLSPVIAATCDLISSVVRTGRSSNEVLANIPVPWAYRSEHHVDREAFLSKVAEAGLDDNLIPLAMFVYRGLAYAGFAHAQAEITESDIATYVAAPGRLTALEPFLAHRVIADLDFPRNAYGTLVETLKLPRKGYDFSFLGVFSPSQVSSLALEIETRPAREALRWIMARRSERDAVEIRKKWHYQLYANRLSKIVGTSISQTVTNSNVGGDLIQIAIGTSVP